MLSIPHLIIIFVVALVVFGPEKLPELARTLGKVMAEFRRATGDLRSTFEDHLRDLEREAEVRRIGGASNPYPPRETEADVPSPGTVPASAPNSSERWGPAGSASANAHSSAGATESHNPETGQSPKNSETTSNGHSPA
jgi:sec-independent protein translocase protein TatB